MKIRPILEELSDDIKKEHSTDFKYMDEESGYGFHRYVFNIGDAKYEAEISGVACPQGKNCGMHSVSFSDIEEGQGITGKGNVKEVFSTVVEIIRHFLSRNPNENLFFSSGDGDRVRELLYKRFTKEAKKFFPGYVGITSDTEGGNAFIVPEKNAEEFIEYYKSLDTFERNFVIHR